MSDKYYDWNLNKNTNKKPQRAVKIARITISAIFATAGIAILLSQMFPVLASYIQGRILNYSSGTIAQPVPDSYKQYIEGEFAYYDPNQSYFKNLIRELGAISQDPQFSYDPETQAMKPINIDETYSNPMSLTIESLDITSVNITPNVHSYDENIYNLYLKQGLAHFQGTPIPGDGGNSLIYGHSAVQGFFSNHQDLPETIFTKLEDIQIGDQVVVERDGQKLYYTVRKKKVVPPNDFSILETQGTKETLTLMTCTPVGIGTDRLIVMAERSE